MRYETFGTNEYFCVSASGIGDIKIFLDEADRARFALLITHFISPTQIYNVSWYTERLLKKKRFAETKDRESLLLKGRQIELYAFLIAPDHFELLLKNLEEQVLSVYMQRVLTAYGKYFNKKYAKRGHVFAGPFKASRIKEKELGEASLKLHRQAQAASPEATTRESLSSSLPDYLGPNRWGGLLLTEPILKHFKSYSNYRKILNKKLFCLSPHYLSSDSKISLKT